MVGCGQLKRRGKQAKYCALCSRTIAVISDLTDTAYCLQNNISQGRIKPAAASRFVSVQMKEYTYSTPSWPNIRDELKTVESNTETNRNKRENAELWKSKDGFESSQFENQWSVLIHSPCASSAKCLLSPLSINREVWTQSAPWYLPPFSRTGFGSLCFVQGGETQLS